MPKVQCPTWFPFLGRSELSSSERVAMALPASTKWEAFVFEWFGFGFTMAARIKK